MTDRRISADEIESISLGPGTYVSETVTVSAPWLFSIAKQIQYDDNIIAELKLQNDLLLKENQQLTIDASQWVALQEILRHPLRDTYHAVQIFPPHVSCHIIDGGTVSATSPKLLLEKLNDLNVPLWRWRTNTHMSSATYKSAESAKYHHEIQSPNGYAVREVKNIDGDILLVREGRTIPEGFK